jgi:hypothetical protein
MDGRTITKRKSFRCANGLLGHYSGSDFMNVELLVRTIKLQTSDSALVGTVKTLKQPPGRKPSKRLLRLSKWYNQLGENDREMVGEVMREASQAC